MEHYEGYTIRHCAEGYYIVERPDGTDFTADSTADARYSIQEELSEN